MRKYQQRGRWQQLPPTVAMLRICGRADLEGRLPERRVSVRTPSVVDNSSNVSRAPMPIPPACRDASRVL